MSNTNPKILPLRNLEQLQQEMRDILDQIEYAELSARTAPVRRHYLIEYRRQKQDRTLRYLTDGDGRAALTIRRDAGLLYADQQDLTRPDPVPQPAPHHQILESEPRQEIWDQAVKQISDRLIEAVQAHPNADYFRNYLPDFGKYQLRPGQHAERIAHAIYANKLLASGEKPVKSSQDLEYAVHKRLVNHSLTDGPAPAAQLRPHENSFASPALHNICTLNAPLSKRIAGSDYRLTWFRFAPLLLPDPRAANAEFWTYGGFVERLQQLAGLTPAQFDYINAYTPRANRPFAPDGKDLDLLRAYCTVAQAAGLSYENATYLTRHPAHNRAKLNQGGPELENYLTTLRHWEQGAITTRQLENQIETGDCNPKADPWQLRQEGNERAERVRQGALAQAAAAVERAAAAVIPDLGRFRLLELETGPAPGQLQLHLAKPLEGGGTPALTITRHPDRTISATSKILRQDPMLIKTGGIHESVAAWIAANLRARLPDPADLPQPERNTMLEAVRNAASRLAHTHPEPVKLTGEIAGRQPGAKTIITTTNIEQQAERIIMEMLIDPAIRETTRQIFADKEPINLIEYNFIARRQAALAPLAARTPTVARYYCNLLANRNAPEALPIYCNPAEVVAMVKQSTGLDPREWSYFCRGLTPTDYRDGTDQQPEWLKPTMRALADANQPNADPRQLQPVAKLGYAHGEYYRRGVESDAWRNWTQLLSQFLNPKNPETPDLPELENIQDALRAHLEQGRPWGPAGTWAELKARSETWHQGRHRQEYRKRYPGLWTAQPKIWGSQLGKTEIGEYTAIPLPGSAALLSLGERMDNCLPTFIDRCAEGGCHIFQVDRDRELVGAVEIRKGPGLFATWRRGEVETNGKQSRFLQDLKEVALELAKRHNKPDTGAFPPPPEP